MDSSGCSNPVGCSELNCGLHYLRLQATQHCRCSGLASVPGEEGCSQCSVQTGLGVPDTRLQVTSESWSLLHSWYGGGPSITRTAVMEGLGPNTKKPRVMLYPMKLEVCWGGKLNEVKTIEAEKHVSGCSEQQEDTTQVPPARLGGLLLAQQGCTYRCCRVPSQLGVSLQLEQTVCCGIVQ